MDRDAVKNILYGGLAELMKNSQYYYYSPIGADYCHWTDAGEKAVVEFVTMMTCQMVTAEEQLLDARAKQMVIDGLTK